MNKIALTFLFSFFMTAMTIGQEMKIHVEGMPDTTVFLAKYYGKKLYYADTAVAENSTVKYDLSKHEAGIYALLVPPKNSYFEIVITGKEAIEISTKGPNFAGNIDIKKSKENQAFYEYISFMNSKSQGAKIINDKVSKATDKKTKTKLQKQLTDIQLEVNDYQDEFFKKNDDLLVTKYLKIMKNIDIPEPPKKEDGSIDSLYSYIYNVNHYFDNVDLSDDRLVRGPMFANKLDNYFSKNVTIQIPDSIIRYADQLISKVDENSEMFKYIVHNVTYKYETSDIMGMDAVFVHMAQEYYCPVQDSKAYWLDSAQIEKICERASKLSNITIGQKAKNLILPDSTEEKWYNLEKLPNDYVVLYFWDPECGHCKKVTPKLGKIYTDSLQPMGVEVYAVGKAMGEDFEKWKKFIRDNDLQFINVGMTKSVFDEAQENPMRLLQEKTNIESLNYHDTYDIYSTPKVFVVDQNRKIIAKGLAVSQIVGFLERYMKNHPLNE